MSFYTEFDKKKIITLLCLANIVFKSFEYYLCTTWAQLKHHYTKLSIHQTIECKISKIVQYTIQNKGKRIIRNQMFQKRR